MTKIEDKMTQCAPSVFNLDQKFWRQTPYF